MNLCIFSVILRYMLHLSAHVSRPGWGEPWKDHVVTPRYTKSGICQSGWAYPRIRVPGSTMFRPDSPPSLSLPRARRARGETHRTQQPFVARDHARAAWSLSMTSTNKLSSFLGILCFSNRLEKISPRDLPEQWASGFLLCSCHPQVCPFEGHVLQKRLAVPTWATHWYIENTAMRVASVQAGCRPRDHTCILLLDKGRACATEIYSHKPNQQPQIVARVRGIFDVA